MRTSVVLPLQKRQGGGGGWQKGLGYTEVYVCVWGGGGGRKKNAPFKSVGDANDIKKQARNILF